MSQVGALGRRIAACIEASRRKDYEGALVHFFPALDKTAKRRRPKAGVGERIKNFVADQEDIITLVATSNVLRGINVDGVTFPEAIYKFGRTAISHEGELDPRLQISNSNTLSIGKVWALPASYIDGLCVGVMAATENARESIALSGNIAIAGRTWELPELWGAEKRIRAHFEEVFSRRAPRVVA